VGKTKRGKVTKIVAIASGDGLSLAATVESASPAECRLVEVVLAGCSLDELPEKLIGDKAYDADALDRQMGMRKMGRSNFRVPCRLKTP
jgi:hypothetical protein